MYGTSPLHVELLQNMHQVAWGWCCILTMNDFASSSTATFIHWSLREKTWLQFFVPETEYNGRLLHLLLFFFGCNAVSADTTTLSPLILTVTRISFFHTATVWALPLLSVAHLQSMQPTATIEGEMVEQCCSCHMSISNLNKCSANRIQQTLLPTQ
jgi:hypothetical protein